MTQPAPTSPEKAADPVRAEFKISIGKESRVLEYSAVFTIGYYLWQKRKFNDAASVFRKISQIHDRGPRAHLFLAHSFAMLGNFGECSAVLCEALPKSRYGETGTELHFAFVSWKCGLYLDARKTLERLAHRQPELPSICLILAELLQFAGNENKLAVWLRSAISRDRQHGEIAYIAQKRLAHRITQTS